jgi:hypothetical protein
VVRPEGSLESEAPQRQLAAFFVDMQPVLAIGSYLVLAVIQLLYVLVDKQWMFLQGCAVGPRW